MGLSHFQDGFPPEAYIISSVTFTKCLYAQPEQERCMPEYQSGYGLPPPSYAEDQPYEFGHEIGSWAGDFVLQM